jgi:hypothetical protein
VASAAAEPKTRRAVVRTSVVSRINTFFPGAGRKLPRDRVNA